VGNEIGGYGWLSTSPEWVGEIGAELQLRPGDGYIWNCFTVPQHRRKGIFRSLLIGIPRIAREEGLRRLWIGTVAIPAEKVVGPSGFTPVISWAGFAFAGRLFSIEIARDSELIREAREIFGGSPGIHLRRLRTRRH